MKAKGLIIEDNVGFAGDVKSLLSTIDHECDIATNFSEAKPLIDRGGYDYFLVDLEIPAAPGTPAYIQNGEQAISRIREQQGPLGPPVIVVTGHGHDTCELAARTMHLGASDYVTKPLTDNLCATVQNHVQRHIQIVRSVRQDILQGNPQVETPFQGGELVFHDDHISLCGVRIAGDLGCGYAITVLEALCETDANGRYRCFRAEELAVRLDEEADIYTVASCIYRLRGNISKCLKETQGIIADSESVIVHHSKYGYQLAGSVTVVNERSEILSEVATSRLPNRQRWILEQLVRGHRLERLDLEGKFKVSERTAKRDFRALVDQGHIEYVRQARPGFYRLARSGEEE